MAGGIGGGKKEKKITRQQAKRKATLLNTDAADNRHTSTVKPFLALFFLSFRGHKDKHQVISPSSSFPGFEFSRLVRARKRTRPAHKQMGLVDIFTIQTSSSFLCQL